MKKIFYILYFVLFFIIIHIHALEVHFFDEFYFRGNKAFLSKKQTIYVVENKGVYEFKNKILIKYFGFSCGITKSAFDNDFIVIFDKNYITAISIQNNSIIWKRRTNGFQTADPVIYKGLLFFDRNASKLVTIKISDGGALWKYDFSNLIDVDSFIDFSKILVVKNRVIFICSERIITFSCFTGKFFCSLKLRDFVYFVSSKVLSFCVYNRALYMLYDSGHLISIDLNTCIILSTFKLDSVKNFSIYKSNIILFFDNGEVVYLDKNNLQILWKKKVCESYYGHKNFYLGEILLLYSFNGNFVFFNLKDKIDLFNIFLKTYVKYISINYEYDFIILTSFDKIVLLKFTNE